MLTNCHSEIKKIYTVKILQKIIKTCLKNKQDSLKLSKRTIESIVDLYYDFEATLLINKEKRSNNPNCLINEMIIDYKAFKSIVSIMHEKINALIDPIAEMLDSYKNNKRSDFMTYVKPFPENVIFKMIKILYKITLSLKLFSHKINNTNNIIDLNQSNKKKPKMSIMDKIKIDIADLIKQINSSLFHVYKKLDVLLSEITFHSKEDQKITDPKLDRLIPYLEAFILMCHLQFNLNFEQKEPNDVKFFKTTSKIEQTIS